MGYQSKKPISVKWSPVRGSKTKYHLVQNRHFVKGWQTFADSIADKDDKGLVRHPKLRVISAIKHDVNEKLYIIEFDAEPNKVMIDAVEEHILKATRGKTPKITFIRKELPRNVYARNGTPPVVEHPLARFKGIVNAMDALVQEGVIEYKDAYERLARAVREAK